MTIHRVGPLPDTAPTRRPLGRVLVTIDDLEALIDVVRQGATDPTSVHVQFSGGYFTDARDLRQLSDDEISVLKIHSDNAEVNLGPTQAVAIGAEDLTVRIENAWARTRQTAKGTGRQVLIALALLLVGALVGGVLQQLLVAESSWSALEIGDEDGMGLLRKVDSRVG